MRKKNLLSLLVLLLAAILFPKVALADPSASSWQVYCGDIDEQVGVNTPVYCYLITQITPDATSGAGIYGALTGLELTNLTVSDFGVPETTITDVNKVDYQGTSSTIQGRTCAEKGNCFDFTAKNPTTGIPNKAGQNVGAEAGITKINSDYSAFTIVGWWQVKLTEDATTENCGRICVYIRPLMTQASLTEAIGASAGTPTVDNGLCKEIRPKVELEPIKNTCKQVKEGDVTKYYGKDGSEVSEEVYKKECLPNTGGWASYAVLAAGAFIALSAITIAKKHNKFYQV